MDKTNTIAIIFGVVLVQTVVIKAEEDLYAKFSQLESQVKVLTHRLLQDEKLIQRLQHAVEKTTHRLQQEESNVVALQRQVELLKQQQENVTNLQVENKHVLDKLLRRNGTAEILIPDSCSAGAGEVAFTAYLTKTLENVPVHTTVTLDQTLYSTDDSYDSTTGIFTCPTSGLYLFAVFVQSQVKGVQSVVALQLEGTPYMWVDSEISNTDEVNLGGNVILLPVSQGQRVWVETMQQDKQSFWNGYTTFSGVMLYSF